MRGASDRILRNASLRHEIARRHIAVVAGRCEDQAEARQRPDLLDIRLGRAHRGLIGQYGHELLLCTQPP